MDRNRINSIIIYSAKCICGALIVYALSSLINYKDISWCIISVILVLSPDGKDSVQLALTRIKANLVGAGVGVLCLLISATNVWILSIALSITITFCYLLKLDAGTRSALAATIIVMLHDEGKHIWDTAFERVSAVLIGCVLGLIITFVFHFKNKSEKIIKLSSHEEA